MARAAAEDLFHSFRFWAQLGGTLDNGLDPMPQASGFSSITIPEYTLEAVEYREGNAVFTKKYPGLPTTADLTFSRGVVPRDTGFFDWLVATMASGDSYRADVIIWHFHRAGLPLWNPKSHTVEDAAADVVVGSLDSPKRKYKVHEAFPIRVKPAGDLDASTADVSIAEADVAYEWFEIEDE